MSQPPGDAISPAMQQWLELKFQMHMAQQSAEFSNREATWEQRCNHLQAELLELRTRENERLQLAEEYRAQVDELATQREKQAAQTALQDKVQLQERIDAQQKIIQDLRARLNMSEAPPASHVPLPHSSLGSGASFSGAVPPNPASSDIPPSSSTGSPPADPGSSHGHQQTFEGGPTRSKKSSARKPPPASAHPSKGTSADNDQTKSNTKKKKKPTIKVYHVRKTERPKDIKTVEDALHVHIAILTDTCAPYAIMPLPDPAEQANFNSRFMSTNRSFAAVKTTLPAISPEDVQMSRNEALEKLRHASVTAARALKVGHVHLTMMRTRCAQLGITSPRHDPTQDAYSPWNQLCRMIIIETFSQALIGHAYTFMDVNTAYARDHMWLTRLYDHWICHHHARRTLSDLKFPGKLVKQEKLQTNYQARRRLSKRRKTTAQGLKHSEDLVKLAGNVKAHSDTEINPETGEHVRCAKPERSSWCTAYFEELDENAAGLNSIRPSSQHPVARITSTNPPRSVIKAVPRDGPLDYFDPGFFRRMPKTVRNLLRTDFSAIPQVDPFNIERGAFRMNRATFMRNHGDLILADYVSDDDADDEMDDDMDEFLDGYNDNDNEDDDDDGGDEGDDDDIEAQREAFVNGMHSSQSNV
ncbi:hypothetical protein BKA62DRAFT_827373 [Auriculariales sp. MPI-PUGE-AT-0066]|nr:hypothetical protein BKA62DRAFT_827373 [Auriculariales sp. MPI-PUGE-AT-0066]